MKIDLFFKLAHRFSEYNFNLYLVGGAVRDYLLNRELKDFDIVTDALPSDVESMFDNVDTSFAKFGSVSFIFENEKIDVTTLREEEYLLSARKPSQIRFVKSIEQDSKRRDFTINAFYMDKDKNIYDFYQGKDDLNKTIIRMIGDINVRIKEDPLRILRAIRFKYTLNFNIEDNLDDYLKNNLSLLKTIPFTQVKKEIIKLYKVLGNRFDEMLQLYPLNQIFPLGWLKQEDKLNVIDLHCDTLPLLLDTNESFISNSYHIDLNKLMQSGYLLQCMAIFINQNKYPHPYQRYQECKEYFEKVVNENSSLVMKVTNYQELMMAKTKSKIGLMLTIEEGQVLEGDINRLEALYQDGVRMMTLTWNYPNCIGYPNFKYENRNTDFFDLKPNENDGLTEFGIEVVKKMNELGMIIDVSHLSDKGFYDVIKYSTAPVVASHSNSREVQNVVRNLTDEMILMLHKNGGVMGINYCHDFVSNNNENQIPDIIKHIQHIKNLGCIDVVSLGSDFDGIATPIGLSDASKMIELKKQLKENNFSETEIEKIFYKNFMRVMKKVLK